MNYVPDNTRAPAAPDAQAADPAPPTLETAAQTPEESRLLRGKRGWLGVALPVVVTVPWVLLLSPLKLVEDVFSIPAALAASALLSGLLAILKRRRLPLRRALIPALCWAYECLPITLPGPFDELLTVFGSGMIVFWLWLAREAAPKRIAPIVEKATRQAIGAAGRRGTGGRGKG